MKITQSDATLGEVLATRENSLNFIRLVFAASVIFGHSWVTGGFGEDQVAAAFPFDVSQVNAVDGFFIISGYLIAGSRMRLTFSDYIWRRFVRIFPAFWVCILVTAFVFAPILSWIVGWTYVPFSGVGYVVQNAALYIFQGGIDSTLVGIPHEVVWNASLWTLFYEFAAYICAGALLSIPAVRRHAAVVVGVNRPRFCAASMRGSALC